MDGSRSATLRRLLPLWTVRAFRAHYRQSAFDLGWSLLGPVITLAGYGFVLTQAFDVSGNGIPYLTFAWCGLVIWTFMANGVMRGTTSLVESADLVRKVAFPKEVVPFSAVLVAGVELIIGLVALVVVMFVQGVEPHWTTLALPAVLAGSLVWTLAVALILATVTAFIRDAGHALPVLLRIGIFVTPVMYPVTAVPQRLQWAVSANPMAVYIEAVRDALLRGRWPDWRLLGLHTAVAVLLLAAGWWLLRRVEGRIADVI